MPIYEYLCDQCQRRFEKLQLRPGSSQPVCPGCGSEQTRIQFSIFAAAGTATRAGSGGCGCGGSGCGCGAH